MRVLGGSIGHVTTITDTPGGYYVTYDKQRDEGLQRQQGRVAEAPAADRGADTRDPEDGRRGPLVPGHPSADRGRPRRARQGRPRPGERARSALHGDE